MSAQTILSTPHFDDNPCTEVRILSQGCEESNIVNIELLKRKEDYLQFSFDIQIKDLKNFTNLISQIKQKDYKFKIVRHKNKKNAFLQRIFENFKRS